MLTVTVQKQRLQAAHDANVFMTYVYVSMYTEHRLMKVQV